MVDYVSIELKDGSLYKNVYKVTKIVMIPGSRKLYMRKGVQEVSALIHRDAIKEVRSQKTKERV